MNIVIETVGYSAAVIEILMGAPQALHTFRQRNDARAVSGLSLSSNLLMFFHTILWCIYGGFSPDYPILIAHALSTPIYGMTCYYILRSREQNKAAPPIGR